MKFKYQILVVIIVFVCSYLFAPKLSGDVLGYQDIGNEIPSHFMKITDYAVVYKASHGDWPENIERALPDVKSKYWEYSVTKEDDAFNSFAIRATLKRDTDILPTGSFICMNNLREKKISHEGFRKINLSFFQDAVIIEQ